MDLYYIFFFAAFLMNLAKPVPDTTLDPLLLDIILAERPEDWNFGQKTPVDSFKQDQAGSFQIAGLDAIQQDQTSPIQQDQSGSFQIAAADAIRPVYLHPGLEQIDPNGDESLYLDPSDDASSDLNPMETDGDDILAAKPNRPNTPKTPVAKPRVKKKVCPSYILGARACCNGPEQSVTTVPGLSELILGSLSIFKAICPQALTQLTIGNFISPAPAAIEKVICVSKLSLSSFEF
ncbi:hypothetical protein MMC29_000204 [Sticta canariensis]|nr:hypothetical protein [Sticta canariensis]